MFSPRILIAALALSAPGFAVAAPQAVPVLVKDIHISGSGGPSELTAIGGQLFFEASDATNGRQPWVSDGTTAGTHMIKAILPSTWPLIQEFTQADGLCFFRANDFATGWELWRTDGTAAGTFPTTSLHLVQSGAAATYLHEFDGLMYFSALGRLWRSDGTVGGTAEFLPTSPGSGYNPIQGTNVGGRMFFSRTRCCTSTGREPWVSDGTLAGTFMVDDVRLGSDGSTYSHGVDFNGVYFWPAIGLTTGAELWRSDGTVAGTFMVKDMRPGAFQGSYPEDLTVSGNHLFFTADDGTNGRELWATDGTTAGTILLQDLLPGPTSSMFTDPSSLTDVNGTLFYNGSDGGATYGGELWKSDGTIAGTVLVADIIPGASSSGVADGFAIGNAFFFSAFLSGAGQKLYRSDGTAAGTVPVFNLLPTSTMQPNEFEVMGDSIFFSGQVSPTGRELYSIAVCELQTPEAYCTPGTTASGCTAMMSATGDPSASAGSGFVVSATAAEGNKDGLFFFGTSGRQANTWGNGTSYQCVIPPVKRSPVTTNGGTNGNCDGTFTLDFNALITAQPAKAPPTGATVQIQCWFRDPVNTSNQTTSLSDALEFTLCP